MRPYATTIYQLFILFIGSVFTMTSCKPVNEQTSFNNPEPMTGFEHTVTFDFQGTKMVIPYGYLARYTQDNATKWLSDTPGQDAYSINLIEISVYYKKNRPRLGARTIQPAEQSALYPISTRRFG